jgi:hypothetical protein
VLFKDLEVLFMLLTILLVPPLGCILHPLALFILVHPAVPLLLSLFPGIVRRFEVVAVHIVVEAVVPAPEVLKEIV